MPCTPTSLSNVRFLFHPARGSRRLVVVVGLLLLLQLLSLADCFHGNSCSFSKTTLPSTAAKHQQQKQVQQQQQQLSSFVGRRHGHKNHHHNSDNTYAFALYQSDTTSDSYANEWYKSANSMVVVRRFQEHRRQVTQMLLEVYQQQEQRRRRQSLTTTTTTTTEVLTTALSNSSKQVMAVAVDYVQKTWWTLPLTLCFIPPISLLAYQQPVLTPSWWKMTTMDYIWQTSSTTTTTTTAAATAIATIGVFLVSNVCYFWAGARLLRQFPPQKVVVVVDDDVVDDDNINNNVESSSLSSSTMMQQRQQQQQQQWQFCRYSGLGLWVLAAGLMSTIFHSAQAFCHNLLAEALCYLDHGIAGASVFYFWHVCGHPRTWNTVLCGITGLLLLCCNCIPGYAWLHSAWHVFSAAAALLWAQQVKHKQQEECIQHGERETQLVKNESSTDRM